MPKRVRMVAEVIGERCTGCKLCVQVCPTVALSIRERRPDEPGPGRRVAELEEVSCYNAQACLEICPEDAIVMHELPAPFDVGFDPASVDSAAVRELCKRAGYPPQRKICLCTDTTAEEIAAAVVGGARSPEQISLETGARTGCLELCLQPVLDFLAAAGHGDEPKQPPNGFQWYGRSATLFEQARPDGSLPEDVVEAFEKFEPQREMTDLVRLTKR
ncbi:MAG: (2Fe-2S)-binding protein [Proteobacteria bacterium]|nr:(2Fe-2S)-binding protein [Pseudomonadota bacterium]